LEALKRLTSFSSADGGWRREGGDVGCAEGVNGCVAGEAGSAAGGEDGAGSEAGGEDGAGAGAGKEDWLGC
jgi:hypothetical protein